MDVFLYNNILYSFKQVLIKAQSINISIIGLSYYKSIPFFHFFTLEFSYLKSSFDLGQKIAFRRKKQYNRNE